MYRRVVLAIFTVSISVYFYGQREPERAWTDKNSIEQHAAYMLQIAYNEMGYVGARVQVREDGARRIFEVDPGPIYHIKVIKILGKTDLSSEAMTGAPSVGDVYSAARINDWIDTLKNRYKTTLTWGVRVDHANAAVTIEVGPDIHSLPEPK